MKKRWKIVGLALLALGLLYMHQHHHITLEQVLNWQPENLILAAVALLCYLLVSRFELSTNRIPARVYSCKNHSCLPFV